MDNNTICYRGIQRIFRNVIIDFIRTKLVALYPNDYSERLKKPFKQEWDKIKFHAETIREVGIIEAPIEDDFDILGVNNFYSLFDAYYDKFEIKKDITDVEKRKNQKQAFLGWLKTIKNFRDPLSHPAKADFTFDDADLLLLNALKVLEHLGLEKETNEIRELLTDLREREFGSYEFNDPLESELPPRETIVNDFIGRSKELELLEKWVTDPESRRWALAGEGGKGKSALAYSFALQVKEKAFSPFEVVFWLSAKKRKYTEGKVVDIKNPDFYDLDSALNKILLYYGFYEETHSPLNLKKSKVKELLNIFPAFIVVDDIDSMDSKDEDVIEFFVIDLAMTKSKVLFTSRRVIFGLGGTTTTVRGFDKKETEDFIISRCNLMSLDFNLFNKKVEKILEITEGSPLYIEDLMRWTLTQNVNKAIDLWRQRGGDSARKYALERECELLTDNARKVLFASCVLPDIVTFEEIQKITEFSEEVITASLKELQNLFLVSTPVLVDNIQTYDVNLNIKTLVSNCYAENYDFRQTRHAFKSIYKNLDNKPSTEISAVIKKAILLLRNNKSESAEDLVKTALKKYPNNSDLIGVLGFVYKGWHPQRRVTDAREKFNRAAQLNSRKEDLYKHWCQMEIEEKEWEKAIKVAELGLKIIPESKLLYLYLAQTHVKIGQIWQNRFFKDKAFREFRTAKDVLDKTFRINSNNNTNEDSLKVKIYYEILKICSFLNDNKSISYYLQKLNSENIYNIESLKEYQSIVQRYGLTS